MNRLSPTLSAIDITTVREIAGAAMEKHRADIEWSREHADDSGNVPWESYVQKVITSARGENNDYQRLYGLVSALSIEVRRELCAIMWLGRGYDGDDVVYLIDLAGTMKTTDDDGGAGYICNKATLGEYLFRGLRKLGINGTPAPNEPSSTASEIK